MAEIKKMDGKEFREMGLLQEINRFFLHPLGLALEFRQDDKGNDSINGIWDCREDPEGVLFALRESDLNSWNDKKKKVAEFMSAQHARRLKTIGFIIQESPLDPTVK